MPLRRGANDRILTRTRMNNRLRTVLEVAAFLAVVTLIWIAIPLPA